MKPTEFGQNSCFVEALEHRTLLSMVTTVIHLGQFDPPVGNQCNVGPGGPKRPFCIKSGRIVGQIFDDSNGNGIKDEGEGAVRGARVTLERQTGDPVQLLGSRITNASGVFAFGRRLDPGEYAVGVGSSRLRKIEFKSVNVTIGGVETHTINIGVKVLSPLPRRQ